MSTPSSSPDSPASSASHKATCPRCARDIPASAVLGACPHCLLAAGIASEPAAPDNSTPPPTVAELTPEFPQLDLLELLGRGGMGAVYKARQKSLDRLVALKLLRPGLDADPSFAERFTREARALAQLNHPGIVTLYEFGRTETGRFFILMEFVDGLNLRQLLAAGRLSPREALAIIPPLCDALQYAHDRGLVHRDIKPENILIDRLGRVKIADFGLAKLAPATSAGKGAPSGPSSDSDIGHWSLVTGHSAAVETAAGQVMGTPGYMAPEQRTQPAAVDHRADIYALGVVLYQMLTGELPDTKQLQPPSQRVQLDIRLDAIVLRALETNPSLRYPAASELKTQVEHIATTPPSSTAGKNPPPATSGPASSPAPQPLKPRLKRWAGRAALVLVLLLLLRTFVIFPYIIAASSIEPDIPAGSWAYVYKLTRHFWPGDIIAYRVPSATHVARVAEVGPVNGQLSITRNNQSPTSIPISTVVGKVVFNTRPSRGEAPATANLDKIRDNQTSETSATAEQATTWLRQIDEGHYAQSWQTGSAIFRETITESQWTETLTAVRSPLGQPHERRLTSSERFDKLPNVPGGPHSVSQFSTRFENAGPAIETVTFTRDTDGIWRASGYLVKPAPIPTPPATAPTAGAPATEHAESWLHLSDDARYAENWAATSPLLKKTFDESQWTDALKSVRAPLGKVLERRLTKSQQFQKLPNAPGGPHSVFQFTTRFEKRPAATETVTFTRDTDGVWRPSGYRIK